MLPHLLTLVGSSWPCPFPTLCSPWQVAEPQALPGLQTARPLVLDLSDGKEQASKERRNVQTNKQTNQPTNHPINQATNRQTNQQTNKRTNERTNKQTNKQTKTKSEQASKQRKKETKESKQRSVFLFQETKTDKESCCSFKLCLGFSLLTPLSSLLRQRISSANLHHLPHRLLPHQRRHRPRA